MLRVSCSVFVESTFVSPVVSVLRSPVGPALEGNHLLARRSPQESPLGPPVVPFYFFFLGGEGSTTKINYRKKRHSYSNLSTQEPSPAWSVSLAGRARQILLVPRGLRGAHAVPWRQMSPTPSGGRNKGEAFGLGACLF